MNFIRVHQNQPHNSEGGLINAKCIEVLNCSHDHRGYFVEASFNGAWYEISEPRETPHSLDEMAGLLNAGRITLER